MIKCICIDDKKKPTIIPQSHWVKEGNTYHITYIYKVVEPISGKVIALAYDLKEIDLREVNDVYPNFLSTRFAIDTDDIDKLMELAKDCAELDGVNIEELVETRELIEV